MEVYWQGAGKPKWESGSHALPEGVTDAQIHRRRRRQLGALGCSGPGNGPVAIAPLPGRLRQRSRPLRRPSHHKHGSLRRRLDPLRMALRPLGSGPCLTACALVLHRRGTDGHRRDYSQLEQGLAALVLVVLAAHLAVELPDWAAAGPAPD
jgi:hypothetical protein